MTSAVELKGLTVLDPTVEPAPGGLVQASRVTEIRGLSVGLIDNGKPKADVFLRRLGTVLKEKYGVGDVHVIRKDDASTVAAPEILVDVARRCHIVIAGVGD